MAQRGRPAASEDLKARGRILASALKAAREADYSELSEEEFAVRAQMSVHTLRKIEGKTANPGFFTVVDLADFLGLDVAALARGDSGRSS